MMQLALALRLPRSQNVSAALQEIQGDSKQTRSEIWRCSLPKSKTALVPTYQHRRKPSKSKRVSGPAEGFRMTATRLARNKHRLNLNCLAAGLGINPTASQASVGEQFPQGPKCGSCLVKLCCKREIQGTGNLAHAVAPESQNVSKLSKVEGPERQPGLPYEFHSSLSQQQGPPHGIAPTPCRNTRSCTMQFRNSSPAKTTLHARIRNSLSET